MYRVLMPVDESTGRAMAQARYVASLPEASERVSTTVLYVFSDEDSLDPRDDESGREPEAVESVADVMAFFDDEGISYEVIKDRGKPTKAILGQAEEREPDTIAVGGRKRSPAGKVLFGSVTMDVLRNTDIPVVVAGEATRK